MQDRLRTRIELRMHDGDGVGDQGNVVAKLLNSTWTALAPSSLDTTVGRAVGIALPILKRVELGPDLTEHHEDPGEVRAHLSVHRFESAALVNDRRNGAAVIEATRFPIWSRRHAHHPNIVVRGDD